MAQAPKKGGGTPDDLMKPAAIRSLLGMIKKDGDKEISAAIALTEDKEGVIMLEKKMKPSKLRTHMIDEAKDAGLSLAMSSIRFGMATIKDDDATVLLMRVNKDVSGAGLPAAIKKRVKLAGFSEVIFTIDESLNAEDAPDAQQGTAPPPPPPDGPVPVDIAALSRRLAGLIKRIPEAKDPKLVTELGGLAKQANDLLKGPTPVDAVAKMNELEEKLGQGTTGAPTPDVSGASGIRVQKSRLAWDAARKRIVSEIDALKKAVAAAFEGDEHATDVTTALGQLDQISKTLDTRLLDSLDTVIGAQDETARAEATQQAQKILAEYQSFVASNKVFPKLAGATPFGITLTIAPTADATFKALQAGLH